MRPSVLSLSPDLKPVHTKDDYYNIKIIVLSPERSQIHIIHIFSKEKKSQNERTNSHNTCKYRSVLQVKEAKEKRIN